METHGEKLDIYWSNFFITPTNLLLLGTNFVKENFSFLINPFIGLCIIGASYVITWFRDKKFAFISSTVLASVIMVSYLHLYPFAPTLTIFLIPYFTILLCEIPDSIFTLIKR